MTTARIRLAGALANAIIIDQAHADCGDLTDDLGVRFEGDGGAGDGGWSQAPWVMCWADFEFAYKTLKKARAAQPSGKDEVKT